MEKYLICALLLLTSVVGLTFGCGDDDDGDDSGVDDDDESGDDDMADDDDPGNDDDINDDDDSGDDDDTGNDDDDVASTFTGIVRDFLNGQLEYDRDVELVEDYSGTTFSPAVRDTSDRNGIVTLSVPAGFDTVAIRTDLNEDEYPSGGDGGQYLPTYIHGYEGGMINATVFAPPPIGMYAICLGHPIASANLSQVIVIVAWGDLTDYEPIGCATVTFSGSLGLHHSIHYGRSRGRTNTHPDDGMVFGLNITSDTVHSVEARLSSGDTALSDSYRLVPYSTHIIHVFFDRASYPTNPTPTWCQ